MLLKSAAMARPHSLRVVHPDDLSWTRRRRGRTFGYLDERGQLIRSEAARARLRALAVPPAYEEVRYAADPRAHIQAVGRDAAGRLQYRYHPEWGMVRERQKAVRMLELVEALPRLRKRVARCLRSRKPTRELALAAVFELVVLTALRPGSTQYAHTHGSRGAVTLLKRHVSFAHGLLRLDFPGKGGKRIVKECTSPSLLRAAKIFAALPGRRFFQYRDDNGKVHRVRRAQANEFLREVAGCEISLKDLRTLWASGSVMETLASVEPAASRPARRKQVLEAVRGAAEGLANTPAICRRSYVHRTVIAAFEAGRLKRFAPRLKRARSQRCREEVLAEVVAIEVQDAANVVRHAEPRDARA